MQISIYNYKAIIKLTGSFSFGYVDGVGYDGYGAT